MIAFMPPVPCSNPPPQRRRRGLCATSAALFALRDPDEEGGTLLDHTVVLVGSNLGNANSHNNKPLPNLFVSMLHRMGVEMDRFASSTGTLPRLELA